MPDKDNQYEYISALQDFNKSVGYLIDAVKAQVENKQDFKTSVELAKEQFEYMKEMAEELKVVSETSFATKKDTEKILQVVEAIKSEKKKGIWDKLAPKDKTKSVYEGIKTITLMAGAILAIGSAFKVVGEVDFASVVALSIALPLIADTFNDMDKSMTPKETAIMSLNLIVMSAGVAGAGYMLDLMPELSFKKMVSVIGVAIGMGVAMYAMSMVADNINAKEIGNMFLIAAVMPVMAYGLSLAAGFLTDMPALPFMKTVETTSAIAVSLGIAGLAIALTSKLGLTPLNALTGSISMIAISGGLMVSSWLLNEGNYGNFPSVDWAKGVGLSMLAFTPAVLVLGAIAATGVGALVIGAGILSMLAVAGGLAATSHIIKMGDYTGGPSVEWSTGVGLSIVSFANALDSLKPSLLDVFLGSTDSLDDRINMIVKLGTALKMTSFQVKGGDYTGGPSKEWSEGVGIAIMAFANSMDALEPGLIDTLMGESLTQRINLMTTLAGKLPLIAAAINEGKGNYAKENAPTKEWSEGVGTAIMAFAKAMGELEPGVMAALSGDSLSQRIALMPLIAAQLPVIANYFSKVKGNYDLKNVPSKAWGEGVGSSVTAFATAIAALADEVDMDEVMGWTVAMMPVAPLMQYFGNVLSKSKFNNFPSSDWSEGIGTFFETFSEMKIAKDPKSTADGIMMLSNAYVKLAGSMHLLGQSMKGIKEMPDMTQLYGGLVTLSLVDKDSLSGVLDVLNSKQDEFQKVFTMIKAQSQVKVDANSFAFSKDRKEVESATKSQTNTTKPNAGIQARTQPIKDTKPQKTKQDELMERMVSIQNQLLTVMQEVADNTSKGLVSNSNMIDN